MRFADIPNGSVVVFGSYGGYFSNKIHWTKVAGGFLISRDCLKYLQFCNYSGSHNYYLNSAVHQWMNGDNGLLSVFTEEERRMLQPYNIKVAVPRNLRKQHGNEKIVECMASLPAASQVLLHPELHHTVPDEGESFNYRFNKNIATRTFCGQKSYFKHVWRGSPGRIDPAQPHPMYPVIKIDPNIHFAQDEGGRFVVSAPTFTFSDDVLQSFITLS